MILTFKIKHHENFSQELEKAYQVALFAIHNRDCSSSKDVKHLGLKSVISNQILKKYGKNKKCKRVSKENIKLVIPHQGIKLDQKKNLIEITSLKKKFLYHLNKAFEKINQIEIDNHYYYLSVTLTEAPLFQSTASIGVDLNATGHSCVVATPQGKVYKLGKKTPHLKKKYKHIRKKLQHQKKWKKLKKIKKRESNIIKDINHKISKKLVFLAKEQSCGINLENLEGIRETAKVHKTFNYSLNNWSFFQLKNFIQYKAKLHGVPVFLIPPQYTSKTCFRCKQLGNRLAKLFQCPCGHVEHADVNAAFNISISHIRPAQSF